MPSILDLVKEARRTDSSDLEVAVGEAVAFKRLGRIEIDRERQVTTEDVRAFLNELLGPKQFDLLQESKRGSIEGRYQDDVTGPLRIHAYRAFGKPAVSIRLLHRVVPDFDDLGLPDHLGQPLVILPGGLVLVYGPTGSGKTTYLATLLKLIGNTPLDRGGGKHIISICDPAEYLQKFVYSTSRILEVGVDVDSYETAIEGVLRKNPSVVELAEARSARAMFGGLSSAEAGHLTFMVVHAKSHTGAIERIVSAFPPEQQQQIRVVLADVLEAAVGLRLILSSDGKTRIPVWEFLKATPNIRQKIREGKTSHITAEVTSNGQLGMLTLEQCLAERVKQGRLTREVARLHAPDKDAFDKLATPGAGVRSA